MEDIAELIEDCPHSTAKDEGQGFALIRTPNIGIGHLIFDNVHRVSKEVYDIRNARAVPQINDIIYAREAPAGNAAIINDKEKVCLGQRTVLIRPMQKWIDSMWLTYTINSPYARKTLISKATGSTVTHVNMENIRSLALPLPPLQEQSRIVESIEHWLSLVDCIEESKNNLQEAIRQTKSKILDLAIHGKLVPQDPTDEPASKLFKRINPKAEITCDNGHYQKLPEGWCECSFDDIFNITMGQSPNGCSINHQQGIEFHQGKILFGDKYLKQSDMFTDAPTKLVTPNSLLLCVRAPVGVVNITQREICIGRGLCSLKPNAAINLDYAYHALTTYQSDFESKSTGSTFKAISGSIIRNEVFALPPLQEQHRIVAKIEEIFTQLDAIEASL